LNNLDIGKTSFFAILPQKYKWLSKDKQILFTFLQKSSNWSKKDGLAYYLAIYLLSVFTITKMLELIIMKYFVEIILFSEKIRYLCKG
jgi:hypothetical protein